MEQQNTSSKDHFRFEDILSFKEDSSAEVNDPMGCSGIDLSFSNVQQVQN